MKINITSNSQSQKIVFAGAMGSGKTTAIRSISDVEPVATEVENMEGSGGGKATTTVAIDFGKIILDDETQLLLYGTPGQERFKFMWPIVSQDSLGIIILINNTSDRPLELLRLYLSHFRPVIEKSTAVVGITSTDLLDKPKCSDYIKIVENETLDIPVFSIDAREKNDVLLLINTILSINEAQRISAT